MTRRGEAIDTDTLRALIRGPVPLRGVEPVTTLAIADVAPAPTVTEILEAIRNLPEVQPGIPIGAIGAIKVYACLDRDDVIMMLPGDPLGDVLPRRTPIDNPLLDGTSVQREARRVREALASIRRGERA